MQRMSGLSFSWNGHGVCAQVHMSSHSRIVESGGLLLECPTLISVKIWVNLLACSVWAMRRTTLLWCNILRFLMYWFANVD